MVDFNQLKLNCTAVLKNAKEVYHLSNNGRYQQIEARADIIFNATFSIKTSLDRSQQLAQEIAFSEFSVVRKPLTELFEALDLMIQSKLSFTTEPAENRKDEKLKLKDFDKAIKAISETIAKIFAYFEKTSEQDLKDFITSLTSLTNKRAVENTVKPDLEKLKPSSKG